MRPRSTDFWIALVDILMTLFLLTLCAAVVIESDSSDKCEKGGKLIDQILDVLISSLHPFEKITKIQKLAEENRDIFSNPEAFPAKFPPMPLTATPCPECPATVTPTPRHGGTPGGGNGGEGGPGGINCERSSDFIAGMRDCLRSKNLKDVELSGCSLRIPEEVLFDYDSANIRSTDLDKVTKIADCIIEQILVALEQYGDKLDVLTIDGYADCNGDPNYNRNLAFRRADAMLTIIIERIKLWPSLTTANRNQLMAFFCARSFGAVRQTQDSNCDCSGSFQAKEEGKKDRRIEIQINWRVGEGIRNWKPTQFRTNF